MRSPGVPRQWLPLHTISHGDGWESRQNAPIKCGNEVTSDEGYAGREGYEFFNFDKILVFANTPLPLFLTVYIKKDESQDFFTIFII